MFAVSPEMVYEPLFALTVFDVQDPHVLPPFVEILYLTLLHVRLEDHFIVMEVSVFAVLETVTVGVLAIVGSAQEPLPVLS